MSTTDDGNERRHHTIAAAPYAILTRDIGSDSTPGLDGVRSGALGPVVTKALQDVLGWKINALDSKGFVNALNQSFQLTEVEGSVRSKWIPRSYAVQTDLARGLAGAQASIYAMAKTLLDQTLPLLDGLKPLSSTSDAEYVEVMRQLARSQLTELVAEIGRLGGPRVVRVNQYFRMLIGAHVDVDDEDDEAWNIVGDPDEVGGTLGALRSELGLRAIGSSEEPSYVNSVSDEQDVTNFRIIVDYVNAIVNGWNNSIQFFVTMESPFLGTQLVWLARQLGVVNEAVEEVCFVMDSVFVGRAERETLWLTRLADHHGHRLPDITLEGLLSWIQSFVTAEGPDIIQSGGKYAIGKDFQHMVRHLHRYAHALVNSAGHSHTAFGTERVVVALDKLSRQLRELHQMASSVGINELPDSPDPEPDPAELSPPRPPPTPGTKRSNRSTA